MEVVSPKPLLWRRCRCSGRLRASQRVIAPAALPAPKPIPKRMGFFVAACPCTHSKGLDSVHNHKFWIPWESEAALSGPPPPKAQTPIIAQAQVPRNTYADWRAAGVSTDQPVHRRGKRTHAETGVAQKLSGKRTAGEAYSMPHKPLATGRLLARGLTRHVSLCPPCLTFCIPSSAPS